MLAMIIGRANLHPISHFPLDSVFGLQRPDAVYLQSLNCGALENPLLSLREAARVR
jgi:hypothetical protein